MTKEVYPLIQLKGITKKFINGGVETKILHGIDLNIYAGEFVSIIGSSGSGKSTLMNILGCMDAPSTGKYFFDGSDVSSMCSDDLAHLRRDYFGFVFQSYNLILNESAKENVELPAIYAGISASLRNSRATKLLTDLGLEDRINNRPRQLSGGQQQRVSIARAMMNGGNVILADEPTGALDSKSGKEVMKLLSELSEAGHTIILITHDSKVASHADRVIEISDGCIVSDTGETIHAHEHIKSSPERPVNTFLADMIEASRMALRSMSGNIFRTMLTMLGIVIGVASVIAMLAIGNGAKQAVIDEMNSIGTNLMLIRPGVPGQRGWQGIRTLVPDDAIVISELNNVQAAIPELTGQATARFGNSDIRTNINATTYNFVSGRNWPVANGTFFTEEDDKEYSSVAVLGRTAAQTLFHSKDPLGEFFLLNKVLFQVIGVMSDRGASVGSGEDQDDVIFVPYSTGSLRLFSNRPLRNITVSVDDVDKISETQEAIRQLLILRHGKEDFRIQNMTSLLESRAETQSTLTILLGSIAAISLLVGGIGVMNIMLVSVSERTREIGVRLAVGARSSNIMQQFLIEAVVVSALGGVIGVAIGLAATAVIDLLGTKVLYTPFPILLAFTCAFITGLLFGYMPARKASKLNPVTALSSD